MNLKTKWVLAAVVVGSTVGGALGGTVLSSGVGNAATGTPTTAAATVASPSGTAAPPAGKFVSNENTSHESGESAAREAQETAGQFPTVP